MCGSHPINIMANYKNLRFQFLLELLKNRGESGASFADIKDYIERRFEDKDIPFDYKERTFERDKKDLLREIYGSITNVLIIFILLIGKM